MSGTRKRGTSPVRFSNNNPSRFFYPNYNRSQDRAEAQRIRDYMDPARQNVIYHKRTGLWMNNIGQRTLNAASANWARQAAHTYNNNNNNKGFNWTCGLYGCVRRFFGRGGATRRKRKHRA